MTLKKKPKKWISFYMYLKLWSHDVWFLRYGVQQMDEQIGRWKKWHTEVCTPPKNKTVMSWSLWRKKSAFFQCLFCPVEIFVTFVFYLSIKSTLNKASEYIIFCVTKTLLHPLLCLLLKLSKSFSVSLSFIQKKDKKQLSLIHGKSVSNEQFQLLRLNWYHPQT